MVLVFPDLWWEGVYPPDVADRVDASLPIWINEQISKRTTHEIAEADKFVSLIVGDKRVLSSSAAEPSSTG